MILSKELKVVDTIREDLEKLLDSDVFIAKNLVDKVLVQVGE